MGARVQGAPGRFVTSFGCNLRYSRGPVKKGARTLVRSSGFPRRPSGGAPQSIDGMLQAHQRTQDDHSGTDGSHDCANLLSHVRFVAVDRTLAAGGLSLLKRTERQPFASISEKVPTFWAEVVSRLMLCFAVVPNHEFDSLCLALDPGMHDVPLNLEI